MSNSLQPHGLHSPWNSPGQNTGVGSLFFSRGFSQPKDRTQVSHIAGNSLPAEPPGKPKNTGVGSLSLLQWIFLTQELNTGSPALQADSLPTELFGAKQNLIYKSYFPQLHRTFFFFPRKFEKFSFSENLGIPNVKGLPKRFPDVISSSPIHICLQLPRCHCWLPPHCETE